MYTGSAPKGIAVGDSVLVSGTVSDYHPDAAPATSQDLALTELSKAAWTVVSTGNPLPAPLVIRPGSVPYLMAADAGGGSIEANQLQPGRYALDFYKSHESELVEVLRGLHDSSTPRELAAGPSGSAISELMELAGDPRRLMRRLGLPDFPQAKRDASSAPRPNSPPLSSATISCPGRRRWPSGAISIGSPSSSGADRMELLQTTP